MSRHCSGAGYRGSDCQQPGSAPTNCTANPLLTASTRDGNFYLVAKPDGRIKYVHLEDGFRVRTIYHCAPRSAAFSPDGTLIATAGGPSSHPSKLKIWSVSDASLLHEIETAVQPNILLCFSPTVNTLPAPARGGQIELWDVATGCCMQTLEGNAEVVRLFFSRRGDILVAIQDNGRARVFPID